MNIDNNLFNSINNNVNITKNQKEMLYKFLIVIKSEIFDPYISDFNFDNIGNILQNLKITEGSVDEIIHYDNKNNILILGKSPVNQEFNTYKSLLNLICQRYDEENKNYTRGLEIVIDGKTYGTKLTDLLIEHLITVNTGLFVKEDSDGE